MAHTTYVANHEWPGKAEKFHLARCRDVAALEALPQRGGVVGKDDADTMAPNLGYSDSRESLIEQGFVPCGKCKP